MDDDLMGGSTLEFTTLVNAKGLMSSLVIIPVKSWIAPMWPTSNSTSKKEG
jgi:hypothetical protein